MTKIKILILQEASRHSENFKYREGLCMQRALQRLGYECLIWGPGHKDYQKPLEIYAEGCNVILFLENYDDIGWTPNLINIPVLKIFWSIDGHVAFDRHVRLCRMNGFDIILNSCLNCVEPMQEYCEISVWFPNCYPVDLFDVIPHKQSRDIQFGYVGSKGSMERNLYLCELKNHAGLSLHFDIMGDKMVDLLKRFKVSFNINVSHDINYRTFESMGAGALMITNKTPGIESLFELGDDILVYDNLNDCIGMYNDLDGLEIDRIAQNGYKKVKKYHTFDNRAKELIKLIEGMA